MHSKQYYSFATRPDTLAPSYSRMAVREAGAVAADAEYNKFQKYMHLTPSHVFVYCCGDMGGVSRMKIATDFTQQHLV